MDEEPNENELEERLYAMIHHVDQTQANFNTAIQNNVINIDDNAPRNNIRRYWHTSGDRNGSHQKINNPKDNAPVTIIKHSTTTNINKNNSKPKEEKYDTPEISNVDLSLFQSPPQIIKRTIEVLDHENNDSVLLETSDEDEVIEVELLPKPTITIESSDEDDISIVSKQNCPSKDQHQLNITAENISPINGEREVSASPVPSVVSSVSDDFIRSDCIALNISSKRPDNHSFDFSLHGSDLLGQVPPSKKKKKKKTKEAVTSTPVIATPEKPSYTGSEICFATPKSKAKNKKQKTKSYAVSEKNFPSADIYDSDSNQSMIGADRRDKAYVVTKKSLPNADVYESDSSQPETVLNQTKITQDVNIVDSTDSNNPDKPEEIIPRNGSQLNNSVNSVIDLTANDNITLNYTGITESFVIANVSGFKESEDYDDDNSLLHTKCVPEAPKYGSTKVPQILFENLDFDNLKGNDKVCKRRRYSLTTLRAEMEKFYNESWGGEDFNHREIQKYMSRDKSLWVIDPKDRMPALTKKRVTCNYCNRPGHRDDSCRLKPPVCYMCGSTGHYEPRCPSKICVNCGSPNHMYSTMCRNCSAWARVTCVECGQSGHPASHCPDLWRRYHNTIDNNVPLAENHQIKKGHQLYCSGCTRRGHLVHTCRLSLPFSGLPINSPYVSFYRPVYLPTPDPVRTRNFQDNTISSVSPIRDRNKRQSKSPTTHETHVNKKRNLSIAEVENSEKTKNDVRQRKNSQGKNQNEDSKMVKTNQETPKQATVEKAPDFNPISSTNLDKKGHMIQDNDVSATSDVITSARIYVTNEIVEKLKTDNGEAWLKDIMKKYNIVVQSTDVNSFLSIRGKVADQETFQRELREWTKESCKENLRVDVECDGVQNLPPEGDGCPSNNIPKKRHNVLHKITLALESLKYDLGDADVIYKELRFLQKKHDQLLKDKVICPQQVSNNRTCINRVLKKLNMILLGQAGLADGPQHLSKLCMLQERIANNRNKVISMNLRKEIGHHFHTIFTGSPRDDYADLLKKYNVLKKSTNNNKLQLATRKNKKTRKKTNSVSSNQSEPVAVVPVQYESIPKSGIETQISAVAVKGPTQTSHSDKPHPVNIAKLTFYHRRIKNSRPAASALKKTRTKLVRQLHGQIASLYKNERMSSKTIKKVKKMQQQAQMFLSNV